MLANCQQKKSVAKSHNKKQKCGKKPQTQTPLWQSATKTNNSVANY
jgi:hypothetical protein